MIGCVVEPFPYTKVIFSSLKAVKKNVISNSDMFLFLFG